MREVLIALALVTVIMGTIFVVTEGWKPAPPVGYVRAAAEWKKLHHGRPIVPGQMP